MIVIYFSISEKCLKREFAVYAYLVLTEIYGLLGMGSQAEHCKLFQAYKAQKYITLSIHIHAVHGKTLFRSYLSQILMDFAHIGVILKLLIRVYL